MKYIVLDLEYNQAFDFEDSKSIHSNPDCPFEIIQIGTVRLSETFAYESSLNLLIKPQIYKRMHPYVEKITGLNKKTLENQQIFSDAFKKHLDFCENKEVIYCTWGCNDIKELYKNILFYNKEAAIPSIRFINVQGMMSKYLNKSTGITIGLKNAVLALGIEMDKPFHNALNDAYYTTKIFQKLSGQPLEVNEFDPKNANKSSNSNQIVDFIKLYKMLEKELGRKLTRKEKRLFRNVYFLGREKKLDFK